MVEISTAEEQRKRMQELLDTTRYDKPSGAPLDKYGMPIIAPDPNDPDEEDEKDWA